MRSMKSRIRAAITAGFAISVVGLLATTGGTVAQLTDTIDAKVGLGVEAIPYGIARSVSAAFHYKDSSGSPENSDSKYSSVSSLTPPSRADTPSFPAKNYSSSNGIRLDRAPNVTSCASSNYGGNTNRCPVDGWPSGSIVSASSGNNPSISKTDIDFQDRKNTWGIYKSDLRIHDMWTSVACTADGVYAAKPQANIDFGGANITGGQNRRTDWTALPDPNTYRNTQQWFSITANNNQTVEVQSIQKTFQDPPRAVAAIVVYATGAVGATPISNFSFVAKSECAVSPDGSIALSDSQTLGPVTPPLETLDTPAWAGSYTRQLATGPITDFSHVANVPPPAGRASENRQAVEGLVNTEQSRIESLPERPNETESSDKARVAGEAVSPLTTTPAASPTRAAESPVTTTDTGKATQTTTSGGPTPNTSTATSEPATGEYTTATGQRYSSATGASFTRREQELVAEAIAAAQDAESGELAEGATFATTSNQLDGATLIITTADGGTLRIVWEE